MNACLFGSAWAETDDKEPMRMDHPKKTHCLLPICWIGFKYSNCSVLFKDLYYHLLGRLGYRLALYYWAGEKNQPKYFSYS